MAQVNESETAQTKERPPVESYDPWEQMFKTHFEAPKLESKWVAPGTDEELM